MNYILHLTQHCNLKCKYCYENKGVNELSFENIKLLIDTEVNKKTPYVSFSFYGGEPLIKKNLIYKTIEYIKTKKSRNKFYFGITTNGTLLDDEFIKFMSENKFINIAYSFDGKRETQNLNRITVKGEETFNIVASNAKKILSICKNAVAMMVVTKNNIRDLSENVKYIIEFGFRRINLLFDYLQDWQEEDLKIIKEQYNKVAEVHYNKFIQEEDIDIFVFDEKIKTYIKDDCNCNDDCQLGVKSINVGTDGNFYPCMQFVDSKEYIIGNCKNGIDVEARNEFLKKTGKEHNACKECSLRKRCKHTCACKNYLISKDVNTLSPLVCELERIIINIADELVERLYKQKSKLFMQKFYNPNYESIKQIIYMYRGAE